MQYLWVNRISEKSSVTDLAIIRVKFFWPSFVISVFSHDRTFYSYQLIVLHDHKLSSLWRNQNIYDFYAEFCHQPIGFWKTWNWINFYDKKLASLNTKSKPVGICPWKCWNKLTINQKPCKAKLENFINL